MRRSSWPRCPRSACLRSRRERPELQAAIAREVRLKRTPTLSFMADPAIAAGERVEEALRRIRHDDPPLRPERPDPDGQRLTGSARRDSG